MVTRHKRERGSTVSRDRRCANSQDWAKEVAFADRDPVMSQDRIGRSQMEIEVRQREVPPVTATILPVRSMLLSASRAVVVGRKPDLMGA